MAVLPGGGFEILFEKTLDLGPNKTTPWSSRVEKVDAFAEFTVGAMRSIPRVEVVVEDVHFGAHVAKPAHRTQGLIISAFARLGFESEFVRNLDWTKHFHYKRSKPHNSKDWARLVCEELEYTAAASRSSKQEEDLRDAYLIARYWSEKHVGMTREPDWLSEKWPPE